MLSLSVALTRKKSWIAFPLFASLALAQTGSLSVPPHSVAENTKETIHGVVVSDPYQWLEDGSSSRTRDWIATQQSYTNALLAQRADVPRVREEVRKVVDVEEAQHVLYRGGRYFILKKMPGHEIASLYVRDGENGKERVLVDPERWSPDHSDTLELINASHNGNILVYSVRHGGRDEVSIHFYDVAAGRELPDSLPEARYIYWSVPLRADGSGFLYIRVDASGPRLYEHRFGNKAEADPIIFGEGLGPEMLLLANISADGKTLVIQSLHGASGAIDLYVKDLQKQSPVKAVAVGKHATFFADAEDGHLYICTNWKAPMGRVMVASLEHPEFENWRTLIPEASDAIEEGGMHVLGGKILVSYMKDARSELRVFRATGEPDGILPLPGLGTVASVDGEWNSPIVSYAYSSFQTPTTFFSYSLDSRKSVEISAPRTPEGLADVVVEQVWYQSKDGTKVPMFLAHKKSLARDGSAPVLLHGYGGFNWSQTPTFSPEVAVWLQSGGVYAVANIRGGNEFGEEWHEQGSGARKQNTFDDFIAAAEWLIANKFTSAHRLAIQGLSNGGLLVTAAITQSPELFAAAIGRYPLIDMVRYERFTIARWWTAEYGSVSDPEEFKTLYSYSPYHHVHKETKYPAVLLITGDGDTRVDPSHSRKMTAMLQNTASERPTLLLYDSKSGHSGSLSTAAEVDQTTMELVFLRWQLGMVH